MSFSPGPPANGDAFGAWGDSVVGSYGAGHAALWVGASHAYVDLHPTGLPFASVAAAVSGDQQVGYYAGVHSRAFLWHGTAASVIDLTPATATDAEASATDGVRQGGVAQVNQAWHAGIWTGTAASFIDLNGTAPLTDSWLYGMAPGQQVGYTHTAGVAHHAAIWSGTAASVLDVNPYPGFASALYGTTGSVQVGEAGTPGGTFAHAGIWFGSASSFVDLHQLLPEGYSGSRATSIVQMPDGSLTIGGWAVPAADPSSRRAFMWTNIPTPGTAAILLLGTPLLARRCRG